MATSPTTVLPMLRRIFAVSATCLVVLAGCAAPVEVAAPGPDDVSVQAAGLDPTSSVEPTDVTEAGLDGGEAPAPTPVESEPAVMYGPGIADEEVASLVTPLAEAEAWLSELEVQWDNGMTYSEIFRAWRSVSAETGPVLAAFEMPADADEAQAVALASYYESVQGAHDEWQSTVDFIVTYITNYTPEILITKAYQEVEVHLRHAAEHRGALGVAEAERPEIVIEALVDL